MAGNLADGPGLVEYALRLLDHLPTDRRHTDLGATPLEKQHAKFLLELAHADRKRRLAHMASLSGPSEVKLSSDRDDVLEFGQRLAPNSSSGRPAARRAIIRPVMPPPTRHKPAMPTIPYMPADLAEPREIVDVIRARRGGTLQHLDRILLHSPPVAAGWNALLGSVRRDMTLSPKLRELAMCAVAMLNDAEYEWFHHAPLLIEAGATPAQMTALRDPIAALKNDKLFDAAERAALALTIEMTRTIKVSPQTMAAVKAVLPDDRQVFELVMTIAAYNMVSRVLVATGIEIE
jgi:alkylhydroperoxidase family enzyme